MEKNLGQILKEDSGKATLSLCGGMACIELGRQELRSQNSQR